MGTSLVLFSVGFCPTERYPSTPFPLPTPFGPVRLTFSTFSISAGTTFGFASTGTFAFVVVGAFFGGAVTLETADFDGVFSLTSKAAAVAAAALDLGVPAVGTGTFFPPVPPTGLLVKFSDVDPALKFEVREWEGDILELAAAEEGEGARIREVEGEEEGVEVDAETRDLTGVDTLGVEEIREVEGEAGVELTGRLDLTGVAEDLMAGVSPAEEVEEEIRGFALAKTEAVGSITLPFLLDPTEEEEGELCIVR